MAKEIEGTLKLQVPAGTCNFNVPSISFAIMLSLLVYTPILQVLIFQK